MPDRTQPESKPASAGNLSSFDILKTELESAEPQKPVHASGIGISAALLAVWLVIGCILGWHLVYLTERGVLMRTALIWGLIMGILFAFRSRKRARARRIWISTPGQLEHLYRSWHKLLKKQWNETLDVCTRIMKEDPSEEQRKLIFQKEGALRISSVRQTLCCTAEMQEKVRKERIIHEANSQQGDDDT